MAVSAQTLGLAAAAGVGIVLAWKLTQAGRVVADAVQAGAIDPTSTNNLAYRGVNAVGGVVADDPNFSLGATIFEWFNPGAVAAEKAATGKTSGAANYATVDGYNYGGIWGF